MNDEVSRHAVLNALCDNCDHAKAVCAHYPCKQYLSIEKLPSAQPDRKKGHWIIKDNPGTGWYRVACSECGIVPAFGFFPNAKVIWNFCPDCGADMRGEQDG